MTSESEEEGSKMTESDFSGSSELGESTSVDSLCSDNRIYQNNMQGQWSKRGFPYPFHLLRCYGNGFKLSMSESNSTTYIKAVSLESSTEEVLRIAGERFISYSSQEIDVASWLSYHFDLLPGLSDEETKNVELTEYLLACAENVSNRQFDRSVRLLQLIESLSSNQGNPVQREVHYFCRALQERIDVQSGKIPSKGKKNLFDMMDDTSAALSSIMEEYPHTIPFCKIIHFAEIQIILDHVVSAKRIHIIDLEVKNGIRWIPLMQGLVSRPECPLELLKITAITTTSKHLIEDTGRRLISFTQTMNLPFSFKIVFVSDFLDLKEDLLELDDEETVAVYSEHLLGNLISMPNRLDSIMRMIRNLNPCVMVVAEVEANHNSPAFVGRFIESLFYYGAYFDCLDACMGRDNPNRMFMESMYFGEAIKNTIATEGEERLIRNVKLDDWREFYARFSMEETDLSSSSLFQANLVVKSFACGEYCTFHIDQKSLIIGWKGTPLHSLSAWQFISVGQKGVE